jgi:hypothetical protein
MQTVLDPMTGIIDAEFLGMERKVSLWYVLIRAQFSPVTSTMFPLVEGAIRSLGMTHSNAILHCHVSRPTPLFICFFVRYWGNCNAPFPQDGVHCCARFVTRCCGHNICVTYALVSVLCYASPWRLRPCPVTCGRSKSSSAYYAKWQLSLRPSQPPGFYVLPAPLE